ncbi:homoserine O-acetyltransferase [Steroidobacter agaridevorans]|uniref:Homoserine O-succinyltransferase n=1 Tax=Steroidobacter agaridevorans TaxID=2695856 RepID=A0A829YKH0_9GAMM|nr:homoserine O-succinyltransferase [Steroidobacter agaridevorans]GFE83292.1 homoserine O-acetyltransferase [Steroidobacter agaridevorans]GFE86812.1 homoserine O-acetyltransferase [Steroidobacter agaridevorans]
MNAVPEPTPVAVHEGVLELQEPLPLHFGGELRDVRVAWRLVGNPAAPVIVALGGISAGRAVIDTAKEKGWWSDIIGPGRALDSSSYRILGIDFLGGSGASTGPSAGQNDFPSIASQDQAEILRRVAEHLQLARLEAIVGASYGGMVALAFAERWPELVNRIIVISAAHRPHPMATAWRSVQRSIVRYAAQNGQGAEGLRLARALAMATYRSANEFEQRFAGPATRVDGRFQFPVESYLLSRGDAYAATYIPEAFVCLSESIDLHQVDPAKIRVATWLVAVIEDQLVPLSDMRLLKQSVSGPVQLVELSSLYGHDAFLKETQALREVFTRALSTTGDVK